MCEAYGTTPGAYLGMETALGRWQVDQTVFFEGRKAQNALDKGENPFKQLTETKLQAFRDPRLVKKAKNKKMKPDGTF